MAVNWSNMWSLQAAQESEAETEQQRQVMAKLAQLLVDKRLDTVAILLLESCKSLTLLGSQAMIFFEPLVHILMGSGDYTVCRKILEDRAKVEQFLQMLEAKALKD